MVKSKWPALSTYINFFPWFMRKMSLLINRPIFYFHSHFANLHFVGCWYYQLTPRTHVSTYVILLKTHSIILIQTILTRNCDNNGGLCMNPILIFGSASATYSFKLQGDRWSSLIFGTGSSTVLRNLPISRQILGSSLTQPSSSIELRNLMCEQALSQWTVCLPLIR